MNNLFKFALLACVMAIGSSLWALDVTVGVSPSDSFATNSTVTFTANTIGTVDAKTSYTWNFDDNSADVVVIGSPTITHVFTSDENYAVSVIVDNGKDTLAIDFLVVEAITPPKPTDPLGVDTSDPDLKTVANPDDGITFSLNQSQGGYINGTLSDAGGFSTVRALRSGSEFTTDFGDSIAGRNGAMIQHRYNDGGIYILSSTRSQNGSETGMLRKTLAFSIAEIKGKNDDPNIVDPALAERRIIFKNFKGKFNFNAPKSLHVRAASKDDTVSVSWEMTLPKGFDPETQTVDIAIGNVVDTFSLDKTGKGMVVQPSPYKSVRFKFPHLKKGQKLSSDAFKSTVTVQMADTDLPSSGFDTEGISPKEHLLTKSKSAMPRNIQVATTFSGVAYAGVAQVNLIVNSDNSFGNISSRSGPSK